MGSCLGHCTITRDGFSIYKLYYKRGESIDFETNSGCNINELQDNNNEGNFQDNESGSLHQFSGVQKQSRFKRITSIFSKLTRKPQNHSSVRLELLDDAWSTSEADYSLPFENLTSSKLPCAKRRGLKSVHSTPGNSLDLEWEHLPEMAVLRNMSEKEEPQQSVTSASAWSRLSSPDSLEWDPVEGIMNEEVDAETEQLLQEIEMLSSKTLKETQEWAS